MKKIKVLHIISSGGIYGSENVILSWMKNTPNVVQSLLVFGPVDKLKSPFAQKAAKQGVCTSVISFKRSDIFMTLKKSLEFIDQVKPDVIHSHGSKGLFYGRLISWRCGLRLIHTNHGFVDTTLKKKINNYIELCISRFSPPERVVAIAQSVKSRFIAFGVKPEILTVLTNAISVNSESDNLSLPLPNDIASHAGGKRIVSYIGRLSYEKGPDLLLRSASKIVQQVPGVFFILAGDGAMHLELQEEIKKLGINDSVFMPGFRSDVQNIMANSELVVMPSRTEGLPLTLLEAMRLGKPIVASRVGDIPDVLNDGVEGLLVAKEDIAGLSNALCRLLADDDLSKKLGSAARRRVKENFDIKERGSRLSAFYHEAANKKDKKALWQ